MKLPELKAALRSGQRVYGTCIVSDSPRWIDVVAGLGLDFVFIDTEHIALDRKSLSWMCQAYKASGLPPIVRLPRPDHFLATMALDAGAQGLIFPYVETVAETQELRGAAKFRPLRGERLAQALEGRAELSPALLAYVKRNNRDTIFIANIESTAAMGRLDDILAVPELDGVLVGPHDLSCSLGVPEEYAHPRFQEAIATIIAQARAKGVGAGVHAGHAGAATAQIDWARQGANLIIHAADIVLFAQKLGEDLARIKASLGDTGADAHGRTAII